VPTISGDNMQAILSVFRGAATLASAPTQVFDATTTTSSITPSGFAPAVNGFRGAAPATPDEPPPATTLPIVEPEENTLGFVPDSAVVCP